jgi:hypothetical protein
MTPRGPGRLTGCEILGKAEFMNPGGGSRGNNPPLLAPRFSTVHSTCASRPDTCKERNLKLVGGYALTNWLRRVLSVDCALITGMPESRRPPPSDTERDIFLAALDQSSPGERDAYLDRAEAP